MAELMMLLIATVAQLVEHLIRNERVAGSNPVSSSSVCTVLQFFEALFLFVSNKRIDKLKNRTICEVV